MIFKTISLFIIYPLIIVSLLFMLVWRNSNEVKLITQVGYNYILSILTPGVDYSNYGEMAVFYKNKDEITKVLFRFRALTDADGVFLLMFHDRNNKLTSNKGFYITMLNEVTPPHLDNTVHLVQRLPSSVIINVERKLRGSCIGIEIGTETSDTYFNYLPPRYFIGCPLYYNNKIVGYSGAVKNSKEVNISEFSSYITDLRVYTNEIQYIVEKDND